MARAISHGEDGVSELAGLGDVGRNRLWWCAESLDVCLFASRGGQDVQVVPSTGFARFGRVAVLFAVLHLGGLAAVRIGVGALICCG
jgi:hypothetical protein